MKGLTAICVLGALAGALSGGPAVAQQSEGAKALSVRAENLMAGDARHQELAERGGDATALLPGDVVHYQLVFTNVTEVQVRHVEFTDPIPAGLAYMAESAVCDRDDVAVSYSIDGGATYAAEPMVEEVVDGVPVRKPASVDQYTHIKWLITGWVQPGAQVVVAFQAQMPGTAPGSSEPSREASRGSSPR